MVRGAAFDLESALELQEKVLLQRKEQAERAIALIRRVRVVIAKGKALPHAVLERGATLHERSLHTSHRHSGKFKRWEGSLTLKQNRSLTGCHSAFDTPRHFAAVPKFGSD